MRWFAFSVLAAMGLLLPVSSSVAHEVIYSIQLSGPKEAPPNSSAGTGVGTVTLDMDLATMRVQTIFSGLQGNVTAAHIHCCTAEAGVGTVGVASPTPTFPDFPSGVKSGSYDKIFDLTQSSSYNTAFFNNNGGTASGAMNALIAGFDGGKAYLNIHSTEFPGGEIRGFLTQVPEPTTGLFSLGLIALAGRVRRRSR